MIRTQAANRSEQCPGLLISVRDETEVETAIGGGADWIDFKEPHAGALGAVNFDLSLRMVHTVAGRLPISAALGELVNWSGSAAQRLLSVPGIEVVKLGFANCATLHNWQAMWQQVYQQAVDQGKQLCAVIYADWVCAESPEPAAILDLAVKTGARLLLIDTWDKRRRSSLYYFSPQELKQLINHACDCNLRTVLAGSLQHDDIPLAIQLKPDLLAVRGAACRGLRTERLDQAAIRELKKAITSASIANENQTVSRL